MFEYVGILGEVDLAPSSKDDHDQQANMLLKDMNANKTLTDFERPWHTCETLADLERLGKTLTTIETREDTATTPANTGKRRKHWQPPANTGRHRQPPPNTAQTPP